MIITSHHPCDLCGNRQASLIAELDRDGKPLRTVICEACGLVFTDPRPTSSEINDYYRSTYRLDYKQTVEPKLKHVLRGAQTADARLGFIASHLRPADRILDVGSGAGEFLYVLRSRGFAAYGIEPNEGYGTYARERLNLPVTVRFISDDAPSEAPFDVITMFHVLEHLEKPGQAMCQLRAWLKPDGLLVIEVPNVEAVCAAPQHRFHRAHLFNFNLATLKRLGETCGFEVVRDMTSHDAGNIAVIFRRSEAPRQTASPIDGNAARLTNIINRHTKLTHYTSVYPYTRFINKAAQYIHETRQTRGYTDGAHLLGAITKTSNAKTKND